MKRRKRSAGPAWPQRDPCFSTPHVSLFSLSFNVNNSCRYVGARIWGLSTALKDRRPARWRRVETQRWCHPSAVAWRRACASRHMTSVTPRLRREQAGTQDSPLSAHRLRVRALAAALRCSPSLALLQTRSGQWKSSSWKPCHYRGFPPPLPPCLVMNCVRCPFVNAGCGPARRARADAGAAGLMQQLKLRHRTLMQP